MFSLEYFCRIISVLPENFKTFSNQPPPAIQAPTSIGTVIPNRTSRPVNKIYNIKGGDRGVNLPSPHFLSQFLPPPYFFEPISPSSLNGYVSFSPSSLLFPPTSTSSQLFWAISPSSLFCSSPLHKAFLRKMWVPGQKCEIFFRHLPLFCFSFSMYENSAPKSSRHSHKRNKRQQDEVNSK